MRLAMAVACAALCACGGGGGGTGGGGGGSGGGSGGGGGSSDNWGRQLTISSVNFTIDGTWSGTIFDPAEGMGNQTCGVSGTSHSTINLAGAAGIGGLSVSTVAGITGEVVTNLVAHRTSSQDKTSCAPGMPAACSDMSDYPMTNEVFNLTAATAQNGLLLQWNNDGKVDPAAAFTGCGSAVLPQIVITQALTNITADSLHTGTTSHTIDLSGSVMTTYTDPNMTSAQVMATFNWHLLADLAGVN